MNLYNKIMSRFQNMNPVKSFSIISLICIIIISLALDIIISFFVEKHILENDKNMTAEAINAVAHHHFASRDFSNDYILSVEPKKFAEFSKEISKFPDIVRIKIYNKSGIIIWSDEKELIGKQFLDNEILQKAIKGEVVIEREKTIRSEHIYEKKYKQVIELYIPVRFPYAKDTSGVVEIYKDPVHLFRTINGLERLIWIISIIGGVLLYLALVWIVNEQYKARLQLEHQLIQTEKFAATGRMAAEVGHELNNYLAIISGHIQLLPGAIQEKNFDRLIQKANILSEYTHRMVRFTKGLLDFSRQDTRKEEMDINKLIIETINFVKPQNKYDKVEFKTDLDSTIPGILADKGQIQQLLINLYSNAADSMGDGEILTSTHYDVRKKELNLSVKDTGPGIPSEIMGKIFDGGFTTKKDGHGFGLPICLRIVKNHNGTLNVASKPGKGTTFYISLPVS